MRSVNCIVLGSQYESVQVLDTVFQSQAIELIQTANCYSLRGDMSRRGVAQRGMSVLLRPVGIYAL